MMRSNESEFIFALSNPGSEKAMKLEVERMKLGWRSGYQRRGFVTFKAEAPFDLESLDVQVACARRLCLSLGKSGTLELANRRLEEALPSQATPIIHHACFRDRKMQGIRGGANFEIPEIGQVIGTVVELGEGEFWSGLHRQAALISPDPAGDSGAVMPEESPSRAWLKLEEAVRFFGLEFTAKDIVVELGCAPGGVVLALLNRGVSVIGVDPAKMAAVVLASSVLERQHAPVDRAWFYQSRKPAALTSKRDLGQGVTWFMSDMNQSPEVVLKECARFCKMAPTIRGVLITLKLTDILQVADKEQWLASLASLGFKTVRLQQLSVHHKEFVLLGLK